MKENRRFGKLFFFFWNSKILQRTLKRLALWRSDSRIARFPNLRDSCRIETATSLVCPNDLHDSKKDFSNDFQIWLSSRRLKPTFGRTLLSRTSGRQSWSSELTFTLTHSKRIQRISLEGSRHWLERKTMIKVMSDATSRLMAGDQSGRLLIIPTGRRPRGGSADCTEG